MLLINTQEELDLACHLLSTESLIGIDTEFERKYHYFPQLSTIQIASNNFSYIIDWLQLNQNLFNLDAFEHILFNKYIIKIFHSSRQDLEIFYQIFQAMPIGIFDTQVAANVCGLGQCVSYSNLCTILLNIDVNKKYQRANWMKRPLSSQMLQYALKDAEYLLPLYEILNKKIIDKNLSNNYNIKVAEILNIENFTLDKENIWKKVKFNKFSKKFNARMRLIAGVREECAREANLPRRHFATDEDLIILCKTLPATSEELNKLKLTKHYFTTAQFRNKLLETCNQIRNQNISI